MPPDWSFAKYHGLGNDFLAGFDGPGFTTSWVRALCDRQRGVGADGVMLLAPAENGAWPVRIFNSDGSRATFSGNGLRIAAQFLFDRGDAAREARLVPPPGPVVVSRGRGLASVLTFEAAALRQPSDPMAPFSPPARLRRGCRAALHLVLGNPHVVLFVNDAEALPAGFAAAADALRKPCRQFPDAVNVSVVSELTRGLWRLRTWERGVGLSPSCASAACAALYGGTRTALMPASVRFRQDGGTLHVRLHGGKISLSGPIAFVFRGSVSR